MKKLVQGVLEFRKSRLPSYQETFRKLALEQKPDTLFIACSDSRVVPNLFASTNPGDLFVLRNVGNLVPALPHVHAKDDAAVAALEFACESLTVSDIVVCGHSECGAIKAMLDPSSLPSMPHLAPWLHHAHPAHDKLTMLPTLAPDWPHHNRLSQANVLTQIDHLKSYPFVDRRLQEGTLTLHAWWFDIGTADVYVFDPAQARFVVMDENFKLPE